MATRLEDFGEWCEKEYGRIADLKTRGTCTWTCPVQPTWQSATCGRRCKLDNGHAGNHVCPEHGNMGAPQRMVDDPKDDSWNLPPRCQAECPTCRARCTEDKDHQLEHHCPLEHPWPAYDGGSTPVPPKPGGQSKDPDQGGSCQAPQDSTQPAPADSGGFTPAPGGTSSDPDQGGSCQASANDSSDTTPASQAPADTSADATLAPNAQPSNGDQGGSSQAPDGSSDAAPAPAAQPTADDQGG
jgi:hypothetical protein